MNQPPKSVNASPSLEELLVDAPSDAKQLIRALLVFDPRKRLTAKEALSHGYVEKWVTYALLHILKHSLPPPPILLLVVRHTDFQDREKHMF